MSTRAKALATVAIPVVALVVSAFGAVLFARSEDRAEDTVARSLRIDLETERSVRLLVDAETAVRGFLLTGDDSYLEPLAGANAQLPSSLDALVVDVTSDPAQRQRVGDLARLAGRRLTIADSAARELGADRNELLAILDAGRVTMDEIRGITDEIRSFEQERRTDATHVSDDRRRALELVVGIVAVLGVAGGLLGARRFAGSITTRVRRIEDGVVTATGGDPFDLAPDLDDIGRLSAVLTEADERLAVRQRAAESERRFREYLTAAAAPAATLIEMVATGEFVHVSANSPRILGWSVDELTKRGLGAVVHPDDRPQVDELLALSTVGESATAVVRIDRADGEPRWMELIVLLAGPDDQRIRVYFLSDVDRIQRGRSDAESLRAIAEEANNAKNDFLSRMSHELRTPLNAILGFTQLLELDELEPQQEEAVGQILRAGRHLLGLINEVLDISRIETGRLAVSSEPVPVGETFDEAWELVAGGASERGIVLRIDPPLDCRLHVRADKQRLKQVFVNLLSNAVKYSLRDTQILVGHELRTERLRLVIRDSGPGITSDKVARLFQPFERLGLDTEDGAVEGVGLGLALSKALVEAMSGAIGVDSEPGAGSRFWVELDVVPAPEHEMPHVDAAVVSSVGLGTILYIEDNSSNLRLVERILEYRPGVQLVGAMTGTEGLARARELHPQVVLLDLDLPDMRGEKVLDELRGQSWGKDIPVVVLSADATPGLPRRLAQLGASAHMAKPVDVQRLLDLIDGLMASPV